MSENNFVEMSQINPQKELLLSKSVDSSWSLTTYFPQHGTLKERTNAFFDDARSSILSLMFAIWMFLLILFSVICLVLETLPAYKHEDDDKFWDYSEKFCVAWFTFEYCIRMITTENIGSFIIRPINIIDFLSFAPYYIGLIFSRDVGAASFFRTLRILRVFNILKTGRYSIGIRLLGTTIAQSLNTLVWLTVYLAVIVIIFSSLIYNVEKGNPVHTDKGIIYVRPGEDTPSPYSSIPASFWWTIVTLTTVGYGDVVPVTSEGKAVAALAMLCGILVLALPINVIGGNFVSAYNLMKKQEEIRKETPKFLTDKARADYYEQRVAEFLMTVDTLQESLDELKNALNSFKKMPAT